MPATNRFLTVVIRLPDDPNARHAVAQDFKLFGKYKEGEITSVYAGDAITENELMESFVHPTQVRVIREQANKDYPPTVTLEA